MVIFSGLANAAGASSPLLPSLTTGIVSRSTKVPSLLKAAMYIFVAATVLAICMVMLFQEMPVAVPLPHPLPPVFDAGIDVDDQRIVRPLSLRLCVDVLPPCVFLIDKVRSRELGVRPPAAVRAKLIASSDGKSSCKTAFSPPQTPANVNMTVRVPSVVCVTVTETSVVSSICVPLLI